MKYINANRLRKEISHRIDILEDMSIKCAKNDDTEMHAYYHGKAMSLDELLLFIDSLQQEQPSLPGDLDEAADKYEQEYFMDATLGEAYITGAEWQKEQDTREMIMSDGSYFQKCYELGKKDMKEQMLKEAVEGFVATHLTSEGTKVTVNSGYLPKEMCIKPGDKVRIIIVKEEKND